MMKGPVSLARFGDIMQMAYVPGDFEAALKFWTETVGAGPFFAIDHVRLERVRYCGEPTEIDFSMMLGYWGEMQIELIRQHNESRSIFKTWRDEGREGLHHVCVLADDIDGVRAFCDEAGVVIDQEAVVPGGGEVVYIDTGGGPGSLVEVLKPAPGTREFFKMMRETHRTWDGSQPVRQLR
jgi:catechol 2,3-dioxygenase-like lactoylglutathione lyase family enzyme